MLSISNKKMLKKKKERGQKQQLIPVPFSLVPRSIPVTFSSAILFIPRCCLNLGSDGFSVTSKLGVAAVEHGGILKEDMKAVSAS